MLTQLETEIVKKLNDIKLDNCSLDCIALVILTCTSLIIQGYTLTKEECDKVSSLLRKYE